MARPRLGDEEGRRRYGSRHAANCCAGALVVARLQIQRQSKPPQAV